jgi:hypothetical protein
MNITFKNINTISEALNYTFLSIRKKNVNEFFEFTCFQMYSMNKLFNFELIIQIMRKKHYLL